MTALRSRTERRVFVDTSAFYALLDRADQWHARARAALDRLVAERRPLFTSNLVVAEMYALASVKLGRNLAFGWLNALDIPVLFEDERDHDRAFAFLQQYDDKTFSYADAVAFALMERTGTQTAFAFDADFQQLGRLVVLPEESG